MEHHAGRYEFTRRLGSKMGWPFLVFAPWMCFVAVRDFLAQRSGVEPVLVSLVLGVPALAMGTWMAFKRSGFVLSRAEDAVHEWVGVGSYRRIRRQARLDGFDRVCLRYSSSLERDYFGDRRFYRGYYLWLRGPERRGDVCLWCFKSKKEGRKTAEEVAAYTKLPLELADP